MPRKPGKTALAAKGHRRSRPSPDYIRWLESRSMLYRADHLSDLVSGKSIQWRNAYGHPAPQDFVRTASVWFTSYPKSIVSRPGRSVLQTLGSEALLSTFREIGIEAIHTGPMKRSGGITGRQYTPSIDGLFDRIEFTVDPLFGTDEQYLRMSRKARGFDIIFIGDLVPAHTGKGADFHWRSWPTRTTRASMSWSRSPGKIGDCSAPSRKEPTA